MYLIGNAIQGMVTIPVSMYQTVVTSIAQMNEARNQQQANATTTPLQIALAPNQDISEQIQVYTHPLFWQISKSCPHVK